MSNIIKASRSFPWFFIKNNELHIYIIFWLNTFNPEKDIGISKRVGVLHPYTYLVCGYKNTDRP
jgi:hypothetical protein